MNLKTMKAIVTLLGAGVLTLMPMVEIVADNETINDQVTKQKELDDGGSGFYRAIVVSEKTLPHARGRCQSLFGSTVPVRATIQAMNTCLTTLPLMVMWW